MTTSSKQPVVLTLDAGGTNFVFSALQGSTELSDSLTLPSNADQLDKCLGNIISGFEQMTDKIGQKPDALSFAFPGPADYSVGVIGDLPNFTSFRGGVPLGPILKKHFKLPVFINNDGDLYAYGEALMGYLPWLNNTLAEKGSVKTFRNIIGVTLGTGFGAGIVLDKYLLRGDNSCGAEIHNAINKYNPLWNAEESVSTRAIQRVYAEASGTSFDGNLMPVDISGIANGKKTGCREAAVEAYRQYGENLGSSIADILTFVDGIVVLGGGIVAAWDLFSPAMFRELGRNIYNFRGQVSNRLSYKVYNLEDPDIIDEFARGNGVNLPITGTDDTVAFDSLARVGVGASKLGASKATSLGSYAYAVQNL